MCKDKSKLVFCVSALLLVTACERRHEEHGANPDSVAGKSGQAAYVVTKETEKAAVVVGKETGRAAKELGHKVADAAKDIHAGWKDAAEEDKAKRER